VKGLGLLTLKPLIYAANVSEDDLGNHGANNVHVQVRPARSGCCRSRAWANTQLQLLLTAVTPCHPSTTSFACAEESVAVGCSTRGLHWRI
jgi:ribosome-binding ATPase YchF (GTP1/OBG family)